MKLIKSLNNNVAMVFDHQGIENIAIGRGISYEKKPGDEIDASLVDKIFILKDKSCQSRLIEIVKDIPSEYLLAVEEIVEMIENEGVSLSDMIYVTLVDHISVSIEREKEGCFYKNPLLPDIRTFYKNEYQLAEKVNDIIEKHFGIHVSDDEIGFITLHIVNASSKQNLADTVQITRSVSELIQIIESIYHQTFDRTQIRYERFVRHLMFLIHRIIFDEQENDFYLPIRYKENDQLLECISRIEGYLYGKFGKYLKENEKNYLKYHILIMTLGKGE